MEYTKLTKLEKERVKYWLIQNEPFDDLEEDVMPYDIESAWDQLDEEQQKEAISEDW